MLAYQRMQHPRPGRAEEVLPPPLNVPSGLPMSVPLWNPQPGTPRNCGKPWENHGKTMDNYGKTMEKHMKPHRDLGNLGKCWTFKCIQGCRSLVCPACKVTSAFANSKRRSKHWYPKSAASIKAVHLVLFLSSLRPSPASQKNPCGPCGVRAEEPMWHLKLLSFLL